MNEQEFFKSQGIATFPLLPGTKKPATPHGFLAGKEESEAAWDKYPDANLGVVCGDGLSILDFERWADFVIFYPKWRALSGETPVALTPHGGAHVFIKSEELVRRSIRVIPSPHPLDILGEGGYAAAPPSVIDHAKCDKDKCTHTGRDCYSFIYEPRKIIKEPHLLDFIASRARELGWLTQRKPDTTSIKAVLPGVPQGNRNAAGFIMARYLLFDLKLGESDAWAALMQWNVRNLPPMGEQELKTLLQKAQRYSTKTYRQAIV